MTSQTDIVIVGGGVISLLSAYLLEQQGARITIVDKGEVGRESSWAGGGILSPLYPWRYPDPINTLSQYSQQHYQALSETLYAETGVNPEWLRSGLLMLECKDSQQAIKTWATHYQKRLQPMNQEGIPYCEPRVNKRFEQALYQADIAQVRNPWLVRSLKAYLSNKKVKFVENTAIEKIDTIHNRAIAVRSRDGVYPADKIIIAGGAWSGQFSALSMLDVRPVMGQMILFKTSPGWLTRIVMRAGKYVIPRADGHLLCGSTIEWNGFEKVTSHRVRKELYAAALAMIPGLKQFEIIKQWSGLRPGSPNGVPYIGEHPEISGLYVNTGHYRYGVVMGLASAQLLTDIIQQRPSFVDKEKYALTTHREASHEFISR